MRTVLMAVAGLAVRSHQRCRRGPNPNSRRTRTRRTRTERRADAEGYTWKMRVQTPTTVRSSRAALPGMKLREWTRYRAPAASPAGETGPTPDPALASRKENRQVQRPAQAADWSSATWRRPAATYDRLLLQRHLQPVPSGNVRAPTPARPAGRRGDVLIDPATKRPVRYAFTTSLQDDPELHGAGSAGTRRSEYASTISSSVPATRSSPDDHELQFSAEPVGLRGGSPPEIVGVKSALMGPGAAIQKHPFVGMIVLVALTVGAVRSAGAAAGRAARLAATRTTANGAQVTLFQPQVDFVELLRGPRLPHGGGCAAARRLLLSARCAVHDR